jgi:ribosomal protein S8
MKKVRKVCVVMKKKEYISDEEVIKRANAAVKIELEKKKAMDIPVAIYDRKTQIIYQVNSDGSKTEVGKRIRKGRYSERTSKQT